MLLSFPPIKALLYLIMKITLIFSLLFILAANVYAGSSTEVVLTSEVVFDKLNPARGDQSPQAGTLWGDRNGTEATGFLFRPVDGFESPPHIHNVTYRGVVISGLVHNDDPTATEMWMPSGSFWSQPAGEPHITSAIGTDTMAYIEIDEGPYLVMPTAEAFDHGERPINVDKSNLVWLDARTINWIDLPSGDLSNAAAGPKVTYLWGNPQNNQPSGFLLKLPVGFNGELRADADQLRAVVIQGHPSHDGQILEPGSYFGSKGVTLHKLTVSDSEEIILYVRTEGGGFSITPSQP